MRIINTSGPLTGLWGVVGMYSLNKIFGRHSDHGQVVSVDNVVPYLKIIRLQCLWQCKVEQLLGLSLNTVQHPVRTAQ
jgi:hypothetical protein